MFDHQGEDQDLPNHIDGVQRAGNVRTGEVVSGIPAQRVLELDQGGGKGRRFD